MKGARPITRQQVAAVLVAAASVREKTLLALGFCTGYRISELLSLTIADVATDGKLHTHVTVKASNTKTKQGRTIVLNPTAQAALADLLKTLEGLPADTPLFLSRKTTNGKARAISRQHAHALIKNAFAEIGEYGNVSTHTLRKTFAAGIYEATGKIELVQIALGHSAITSTVSYLSFNTQAIDKAIQELFQ